MERTMKDSYIEWVGKIPENWLIEKNKHFFSCEKEIVGEASSSTELLSLTTKGVRKKLPTDVGGKVPESYDTYQIVRENDLIMCLFDLDCSAVFSGISRFEGMISPAYKILKCKEGIVPEFADFWFSYVFDGRKFKHYAKSLRYTLNYDEFGTLPLIVPPIEEQKRIVQFLKKECERIDTVIDKTRESIEEYRHLKNSIITQAVTKGIDDDIQFVDSGIEWAGDIPKHWIVTKINRIGSTSSGSTPLRAKDSDYFDDATIRWVRTLDLNDWLVSDSSEKITELALKNSSCNIMPANTVMVAMYGGAGTIGKCGMLTQPCATNQAVCSIVCDENKIIPKYLLFQLLALKKYWMLYAVGTRKDPNISQDIVGQMRIVVPPMMEQKQIVDFLEKKYVETDKLIEKKEYSLSQLEQYRKAIIYEYITGKKEVPHS